MSFLNDHGLKTQWTEIQKSVAGLASIVSKKADKSKVYEKDEIYTKEEVYNKEETTTSENPVFTGFFSMNRKLSTHSGAYSFAEGRDCTASGDHSHAEGWQCEATENCSHAEGNSCTASGSFSHAEGYGTTASGDYSHAEGILATASGDHSHAEGGYTIANGSFQHVHGKCNLQDTEDKYSTIVGNGTSDIKRSNAHTLDWNGNGWFAGTLKVGGTGQDDEAAKEIATEEYVDNKLASSFEEWVFTLEDGTTVTKKVLVIE